MKNVVKNLISLISLLMAFFHLYSGGFQLFPGTQQRAIHLGLALALIFLSYPVIKKKDGTVIGGLDKKLSFIFNVSLAIAGLIVGAYLFLNYMDIATQLFAPSQITLVIGVMAIILTLEAGRRVLGWAQPAVAFVFLLYVILGDRLPVLFAHSGYSWERIITQIGLSSEGIFGIPLGVSATYIVLFVMFGAMLESSGAGQLFIELAMALVGKYRGGAAKVSVVASAFFGTISGSPVANVSTTGVLTIPLMKKGGFKPEYAAGVEAVASTGGIFLPPVMGAVSFLIADFLQVDYTQVIYAAAIPALLYFSAVFMMTDMQAAKHSWSISKEIQAPNLKELIRLRGHLLLPIILLIFLLLIVKWSPSKAAFWTIVSIPVFSALRKETLMRFNQIIEALKQGVRLSLMVAVATACAGIIVGVVSITGIGLRFSGLLLELSGGHLFIIDFDNDCIHYHGDGITAGCLLYYFGSIGCTCHD